MSKNPFIAMIMALNQFRDDPSKLSNEMPNYHLIYRILETDGYMFLNSTYQLKSTLFFFDKKNH